MHTLLKGFFLGEQLIKKSAMLLWVLALVSCVRCAPTQPGPQVQHLKVSPLSPCAIFVSWKQPDNVSKGDIKQYTLSGSINEIRHPGDLWVFCFVDIGLTPGSAITVQMVVEYNNGPSSSPQVIHDTMPHARKYFMFLKIIKLLMN